LPKTVVTLYRRCRPTPPQLGHCLWAQVDKAPGKRPVPLQVRHLRNGVSQIDTSHMTKPATAVIIAPVSASCVRVALPKNTAAKIKIHPMPVMVPHAAGKRNRRPGRIVSFAKRADRIRPAELGRSRAMRSRCVLSFLLPL